MDKKMLQHNKLDSFFTEALMHNVPNWDMDTIRNAALICSNALLVNHGYLKNLAPHAWVNSFMDEVGREVAVMGLHNHGFSTTIQKYLIQKNGALVAYIEQEKANAKTGLFTQAQVDEAVEKATREAYELLRWKYKELNGQTVDNKFVEAYNILMDELTTKSKSKEK